MPYIIRFSDLFLADFFPTHWHEEPTKAVHFEDQDRAADVILNLCRKKPKPVINGIKQTCLVPSDFSIIWIDSPVKLEVK